MNPGPESAAKYQQYPSAQSHIRNYVTWSVFVFEFGKNEIRKKRQCKKKIKSGIKFGK